MGTDNFELDDLNAPLDIIEQFDGDVEKIKAFKEDVAKDADCDSTA